MSAHWRLAVRYAAGVILIALLVCIGVWLRWGEAQAGALGYGVGVGLVCFVSTALTVSLLTGYSRFLRTLGVTSFVVRYGFAAGALGIPAYMGLWPSLAMLGGFSGVYVVENILMLSGFAKSTDMTRA